MKTIKNKNKKKKQQQCHRVYINVFHPTSNLAVGSNIATHDNGGAIICCNDSNSNTTLPWWKILSSYEHGICSHKIRALPFAKSITRFPDSWILSILPLLLRIVVSLLVLMISKIRKLSLQVPHASKLSTTIKRFIFYFIIMMYRGWVLYIFVNDIVVPKLLRREIQQQHQEEICWYSDYLLRKKDGSCHGQKFDSSDHIVLFFAHFLPLLIFEALFCLQYPFWPLSVINNSHEDKKEETNSNIPHWTIRLLNAIIPLVLYTVTGYLTILIWLSTTITAAYYHSRTESITGYLLSLTVQIPIGYILLKGRTQTNNTCLSERLVAWIQCFVGLSSEREHLD